MELCIEKGLLVANTLFNHPDYNRISYRHLGTKVGAQMAARAYGQIDHVLCSPLLSDQVLDCFTDPMEALNSHHFVTIVNMVVPFEKFWGSETSNEWYTTRPQLSWCTDSSSGIQ